MIYAQLRQIGNQVICNTKERIFPSSSTLCKFVIFGVMAVSRNGDANHLIATLASSTLRTASPEF